MRARAHTHMMVFVRDVRYFCTISAKTKVCTRILTERQELQFQNNPFTDSSLFHEYRQTSAPCSAVNESKNPSRQENVSNKLLYSRTHCWKILLTVRDFNPYPTAFPYGNGMVLHFYQQQESSTTKTVHKVINKGLKAYV